VIAGPLVLGRLLLAAMTQPVLLVNMGAARFAHAQIRACQTHNTMFYDHNSLRFRQFSSLTRWPPLEIWQMPACWVWC